MFAHLASTLGVGVAITDRHGGASRDPWSSLNLGDHVGDDQIAVVENRARVARALAGSVTSLAFMQQVHGSAVRVVDGSHPGVAPGCDAIVSRARGVALVVLVADCLPVLLWDARAAVVAAAHAGRRGLAAGVVPAAVSAMRDLGAEPERIGALIGPGICSEHYEVPDAMRSEVAAVAPAAGATTSRGTPALDLRRGLLAQIAACGLPPAAEVRRCTAESDDLYSHRRDGRTGRFAGLVWLEP